MVVAEVISTERIDLLPLRVEHADEMTGVLSDPALHTFIGGAPDTMDEVRSRYRRLVAGSPDPSVVWCNWVLNLREAESLVGTVQATISSLDREPVAEIAWIVGTPWQGRGIASEATRGLVGWLTPQVHTVVAHIHLDHVASAAVAAACGLWRTELRQDEEFLWTRSTVD